MSENLKTVIQTDKDSINGQNKCPKCGATDILMNANNGHLRCGFCHYEFEPKKISGFETDLKNLTNQIIGSGATDIEADVNDVLTFKCSSCGAEVVVNTFESVSARCHWCRNVLSVNQQISNGSIPDAVLPFYIKKEEAKTQIENFVEKRKFFSHPKFKKEFTTGNIMGVYFPYMIVDVNSHVNLFGSGEKLIEQHIERVGDHDVTYYAADLYKVEREFDIVINGLTVESSSDKLNNSSNKTNNIINSIMPFDIENCVKWDSNYLRGYSSERRDVNIEQLKDIVDVQSKDISKFAANETLKQYDRGVSWQSENLDIKGQQWKAAYLPVWLYSYQQIKGGKKLLHYVAVNARTKETMGSVPLHIPKLLFVSSFIEILGIIAMIFINFDYNWLFLSLGFIYYLIIYIRYRNSYARHMYELETKTEITNMRSVDKFVSSEKRLTNKNIKGYNNYKVNGKNTNNDVLDLLNNRVLKK